MLCLLQPLLINTFEYYVTRTVILEYIFEEIFGRFRIFIFSYILTAFALRTLHCEILQIILHVSIMSRYLASSVEIVGEIVQLCVSCSWYIENPYPYSINQVFPIRSG